MSENDKIFGLTEEELNKKIDEALNLRFQKEKREKLLSNYRKAHRDYLDAGRRLAQEKYVADGANLAEMIPPEDIDDMCNQLLRKPVNSQNGYVGCTMQDAPSLVSSEKYIQTPSKTYLKSDLPLDALRHTWIHESGHHLISTVKNALFQDFNSRFFGKNDSIANVEFQKVLKSVDSLNRVMDSRNWIESYDDGTYELYPHYIVEDVVDEFVSDYLDRIEQLDESYK